MSNSKNFSEPIIKVGDGVAAEESGIASNQPGLLNDPKMTFDPTTQRWNYSNNGITSQPIGSAPQFATEAEAIAAGLMFAGASYFNTTDGQEYIYVSNVGLGAPGFLNKLASDVCFYARDTAAVAVPHNSTTTALMNIVSFDSHNAYNPVTGEYTIPKDGKYLFIFNFGLGLTPLNFSTRYVFFARLNHPGTAGGATRSSSANSTQAFNNIVGACAMAVLNFTAGQVLLPEVFQFNNDLATLPSNGSIDTNLSIVRVG